MPSENRPLTSLRGLAAVWVMLSHYTDDTTYAGLIGMLLAHVDAAVDLFFVLSGFVLAMVYGGEPFDFTRFLGHRIARIYPLYGLTTLVCFAMLHAGLTVYGDPTSTWPALLSNLLMIQSWGWPSDSLNGPGWSISIEWAANLLFPVFAIVLLRWPIYRSTAVIAAAAMLVIAVEGFPQNQALYWNTPLLIDWAWLRVPQPLLTGPVFFMIGMFCWRLTGRGAWTRGLAGDAAQGVVLLGMAGLFLTQLSDVYFVVLAAMLIAGLSFRQSWLSRLLALQPLHWLGSISLSIYMVHAPLLSLLPVLMAVLERMSVTHAHGLARLLLMSAAIGMAHLSFHLIEVPSRRWLRHALDRTDPSSVVIEGVL